MGTYEGWVNWETWLVNTTLDNEERLYKTVIDLVVKHPTVPALAKALQSFVERDSAFAFSRAMLSGGRDSVATMVLQTFLDDVEWDDIAREKLGKD